MRRRSFLRLAPLAGLGLVVPPHAAARARGRRAPDDYDEALLRCHRFGPEYRGGLSNHAPMAIEALVALGRPEEVLRWVERYEGEKPLEEAPGRGRALDAAAWRAHLGRKDDYPGWVALFEGELGEGSWSSVLRRWLPRLVPGLPAAAAHGILRTSHAVRALERADTPVRQRELALGLAYWAARYQRLPGEPHGGGRFAPREALAELPALPPGLRRRGLLATEILALEDVDWFAPTIDLVDATRPDVLSDLVATFARLYLEESRANVFAFVHAVTGPASLRVLLPYLEPDEQRVAVLHAWQLAAALHCVYSKRMGEAPPVPDDLEPGTIAARAVENGNAHALKLTAACLQEWRPRQDPCLLQAAWHAARTLTA